jgi:exosortase/archaeosortase family protein
LKAIINTIWSVIKPYKEIAWFLFLFVAFEFLWKLLIDEGEQKNRLLFLGRDITAFSYPICLWTAECTHWVVHTLLGYQDFVINNTTLYFAHPVSFQDYYSATSLRLNVAWECTGITQMLQFAVIMAFYYGPVKKKLWYIPLSMLILNVINIARIVASAILTENGFPQWFVNFNEWYHSTQWVDSATSYYKFYVDWFQLFHQDLFRWLYYNGVIFVLWLIWQERYNQPYQRLKKAQAG